MLPERLQAILDAKALALPWEEIVKFKVTWAIDQDKWLPVLGIFSSLTPEQRADAGDGVQILGRWHDMGARTGVAIFEADDLAIHSGQGTLGPLTKREPGVFEAIRFRVHCIPVVPKGLPQIEFQ